MAFLRFLPVRPDNGENMQRRDGGPSMCTSSSYLKRNPPPHWSLRAPGAPQPPSIRDIEPLPHFLVILSSAL
jgi:hypothetical protein